ncbi:ATP-dependent DNA helicase PIF2 [Folsomia candida]|uniref:ATP-dependent DNA helicase n=1 Tax=Folsomia candida TaxID=158441 RepID=A0A226D6P5_FOLCA|nr:ATP-dependent DNA helicase PIF2 [Folsomia candida]
MASLLRHTICPSEILQQYSISQLQQFFKNKQSEQFVFEKVHPDFTPNEEQQQVLKYIDVSLSNNVLIRTYLTGLSGSGKTETIKSIVKIFRNHNITPLFCSAFGKISSEIGGQTIHSLLPIGYYKNSNYAKLAKKIKRSPQLVAKLCKTSFGGLHVVVSGDILQLNCVCATSLTSHSKNVPPFAKEGIKLFRTFHPVFVLQVNQRQNGDEAFQELLMRLRRKEVTQADVDLLNSRRESVLSNEELTRFDKGLFIFPRNIFTRLKNQASLKQLGNPIISLRHFPEEPKLEDYDCDEISIGCRVKVKRNFDVANRLVSGSVGISYVALSRVRALSDLILDKEVSLKRFQSRKFFQGFGNILKEYKRLNITHLIFGPKPLQNHYYSRDFDDESEKIA